MKRLAWLLLPALLAVADDDKITRGAAVYRTSCAVAYCHGPEGKPGRAPGFAGRHLDFQKVIGIAAMGIPNTSMPAFGMRLKPDDLEAVAAYIVSLGENAPKENRKPGTPIPAAMQQSRALFFDAGRPGACGSCHEIGGWGVPVSIALQDLRSARLADPRAVETPDVVTVRPTGEEPFPAVVSEKTPARVRVYDLSSRLPVLRTFSAKDVVLTPGASWRHSAAASLYSDEELAAISRYLRWAAEQ